MMCGGTSDAKEMTPEVIEVCHQIRPALEEKLGSPCATFEPKSFKSQVSNILNTRKYGWLCQPIFSFFGYGNVQELFRMTHI